jgi:hypothetical protein
VLARDVLEAGTREAGGRRERTVRPDGMAGRDVLEAPDEQDVLDRSRGRERGERRGEPETADLRSGRRQCPAGPHLEHRDEDERALGDARVRDGQRIGATHLLTVHEQVDVDRARTPALLARAVTTEQRLQLERLREQRLRTDRRARSDDEVQVVVLRHVARVVGRWPRRRRVDGGA